MIFNYPIKLYKPINEYAGVLVYRVRDDKLPRKYKKEDLLKVETEQGIGFVKMASVENAEKFEQVFKFPNNPMKLRQIVIKPISKEAEERIKYDNFWVEDKNFIKSLI